MRRRPGGCGPGWDAGTVIAADIAAELELPVTGEERQVYWVIGANVVEVVEVDEWMLGDIPLERAEIAMIDMPSPPQGHGCTGCSARTC